MAGPARWCSSSSAARKTRPSLNLFGLHHAMLGTVIKELRELKGGRGNQLRLEHAHKD